MKVQDSTVAVILLNFNGSDDTIECVKSFDLSVCKNYCIIIVDNCSQDESYIYLKNNLLSYNEYTFSNRNFLHHKSQNNSEKIILIRSDKNGGFAYGCNIGIKYALTYLHSDYIWLLNNDTIINETTLHNMVEHAHKTSNKALIGSVIKFYGTEDIQAWGGGTVSLITGLTQNAKYKKDLDYINGASFFIPREIINCVGLLDDRFFMYWEDTDYSFRARKKGYFLDVADKAVVYHKHNVNIKKSSTKFRDRLTAKGLTIFFLKNYKLLGIWPVFYRYSRAAIKRLIRIFSN